MYIGQVLLCLSIDRDGVEVNKLAEKNQSQHQAISNEQAWSINNFFYGFCRDFSCGTQQVVFSGQDSSILPAHGASHILKVDFDLHAFHGNNNYC